MVENKNNLLASSLIVYVAIENITKRGPCSYEDIKAELDDMGFHLPDPDKYDLRKKKEKSTRKKKDKALESKI